MTTTKLMKGLLGASALVAFSTGTAFAQNNFTPADTDVSNSFTLDYNVGGVAQPQIETVDDPADPGDDNDPTTFKVDRLVNVTVNSNGTQAVAPGQTDAALTYTVTNNGNDTHAYFLGIEEVVNGTGDDDFDTDGPSTQNRIEYSTDGGVTFVDYDPASPPVLAPDAVMTVRVHQDIPTGVNDTEQADIILYADTRDNVAGFPATGADADGANDTNSTENVLADEDGPADAAFDDAQDGAHSALNSYIVNAADITATKDVFVLNADYDGTCTAIGAGYVPPSPSTDTIPATPVPNNGYHRPDACVEYFITVRNDGTSDATDIDLTDNLPANLIYQSARVVGDLTGGGLSEPAVGTECNGNPSGVSPTCPVILTGATLAGKATPAASPTEGVLVIRATIQ